MNKESIDKLVNILNNLIDKDYGTIAALNIIVELLIENGSLDKSKLLEKIDEAELSLKKRNKSESFSEAILGLGNSISPGRYQQDLKNNLSSLLENWNPTGNKH